MVYDLLITNVLLVDGYWDFPYRGSVLIHEGTLEVVSACRVTLEAKETFDGGGLYLIPGLVDITSIYGDCACDYRKAVTTKVSLRSDSKHDEHRPWLQDYTDLRSSVTAPALESGSSEEVMMASFTRSCSQGAQGLSVDLCSVSACNPDESFLPILSMVASRDLLLLVHISDDGHSRAVLESLITLAHITRTRVHVAGERRNAEGTGSWEGRISAMIAEAAHSGLEITCTWYPHLFTDSSLPQTVKQLCALPAEALHLRTSGIIRTGYDADLVLLSFDENYKPKVQVVWSGGRIISDART
ncbi:MAG: hypothetical protein JXK93_08825 [Sphaerochaetaceae bacterium]|nr:hypothetical protein [Sphaerochaetaceae bacterium]